MSTIRVVIVDDHYVVVECLRDYLRSRADFSVVGMAHTADSGLKLVRNISSDIDVVVVDLNLPCTIPIQPHLTSGIWLIAQLRQQFPDLSILVFTGDTRQIITEAALRAGANAIFPKTSPTKELAETIRRVHLEKYPATEDLPLSPITSLTSRELQVLYSLSLGRTDQQIADELSISDNTVNYHLKNVFAKLGVSSRSEAASLALQ